MFIAAIVLAARESTGVHVRKHLSHETPELLEDQTACADSTYGCCYAHKEIEKGWHGRKPEPMVLFSSGCSGSSAMIQMIRNLAEIVHEPIFDCGCSYELTKDIALGMFGEQHKDLTREMHEFVRRANQTRQRLLFKHEAKYASTDPRLMTYLTEIGASFVNFRRSNKLDLALCLVHDCFLENTPKPVGYEVDDAGSKLQNCEFRGRGSKQTTEKHKVIINTDGAVENFRKLIRVAHETTRYLTESGAKFASGTYEKLFRFQRGRDQDIDGSAEAWKDIMSAFSVEIDETIIRNHLSTHKDDHDGPEKHSSVIANYDALKATLESCTDSDCEEMRGWLRE